MEYYTVRISHPHNQYNNCTKYIIFLLPVRIQIHQWLQKKMSTLRVSIYCCRRLAFGGDFCFVLFCATVSGNYFKLFIPIIHYLLMYTNRIELFYLYIDLESFSLIKLKFRRLFCGLFRWSCPLRTHYILPPPTTTICTNLIYFHWIIHWLCHQCFIK